MENGDHGEDQLEKHGLPGTDQARVSRRETDFDLPAR